MLENSIVSLADNEGILLDVIGNNELCPVGSCLQENIIGTNAVGITLLEKKTSAVNGYEHYRKCMRSFYSVGTPIWYEAKIIGVIHWASLFNELPVGTRPPLGLDKATPAIRSAVY